MRTLFLLLLTAGTLLTACGGEEATTTNKTENTATTSKEKKERPLHQKYAKTPEERAKRNKEKMSHYADDVFMNRAVRASEAYCACKEKETADAVKECQNNLLKLHENKKDKFPEEKYKIYDKAYQEEIAKCK